MTGSNGDYISAEIAERRITRERTARKEAERLLESKSLELYQANIALNEQARKDAATGLMNRRALHDEVSRQLPLAQQTYKILAFALVDVDRFKRVNEALGHQMADRALIQIAKRLGSVARDCTLARWGGDEFAIVVMASDLDEVQSTFSQILEVACSEYFIAGRSLKINCSIGVAVAPHHGKTCEDLERFADAALNVAKSKGRGACVVLDDTLRDALRSRSVMEIAMRDAVHCHTMMPWFQPIYDIDDQRMASLEILARWIFKSHGLP